MKQNKPLAIGLIICTALFILTASIAAPILIRGFYYIQIEPLGIMEDTGLSMGQIRQAYDEMMDFCMSRTPVFSTGELAWSEWGRSHFVDVRGLFSLNMWVLFISGALLTAWAIIKRKAQMGPQYLAGRSIGFWAGSGLLSVFVLIGALGSIDFNTTFTIFHKIFFPGKDNWIFNWYNDQIIRVLPQQFFMNCAILIGTGVLAISAGVIVWEIRKDKKG